MEKFKSALGLHETNSNYLNLNALYDCLGDDLIKYPIASAEDYLRNSDYFYIKYPNNVIITSIVRNCVSLFQMILYNERKNSNMTPLVLELSNREIFNIALKHFFNEDIMFLNFDAVYDDFEFCFTDLVDSLRNKKYIISAKLSDVAYEVQLTTTPPDCLFVFVGLDIMKYIVIWFHFLMAKIELKNIVFYIGERPRCINHISGTVCDFNSCVILSEDYI